MFPTTLTSQKLIFLLGLLGAFNTLLATTYLVGPGKTYTSLQSVADLLSPGDIVLVDGNATYPANVYIESSGNANNWIRISGLKPANGTRPKIAGTGDYGVNISGDYVLFEGFEVIGGPKGIGVFGDNITVRACVVHGCNHGIIGYGTGTGNVTVEYCELYGNGVSTGIAVQHQIYMATDEAVHPGAVFRLQYCYIHDGVEGDNVKSRAERNEIYYNWIEFAGTIGHGLGLFAPDPDDNKQVSIATAREDADVVGNVVIQARNACARIGGDLEGYPTNGRYRFVNNTFILTAARGDVIRTFNTIETLEMYNNAVYAAGTGDFRILNDDYGAWVHTPRSVIGSNNRVISSATMVPVEWTSTTNGSTSPFVNATTKNYQPLSTGPLVNAGTSTLPTIAAYPFLRPLFPPLHHPPEAALIDTGSAQVRPTVGVIDIGAFEALSASNTIGIKRALPVPERSGAIRVYGLDGKMVRELSDQGQGVRILRTGKANGQIKRKMILNGG